MAEFKIVIGTKSGKCVQKEVKDAPAKSLLGKKIGEKISGDEIGLAGYELELTGGSDYCGFPMRKDVQGTARKRILAISGVGLRKKGKGTKQRKTVCGNTVHSRISQVNLRVLKEGKEKLGEEKKEERAAEVPKEGKKEGKKEAKPAEKKESKPEAPKEEKKEEKKEAPKEGKKPEPKKEEPKPEEKKEKPEEKKE